MSLLTNMIKSRLSGGRPVGVGAFAYGIESHVLGKEQLKRNSKNIASLESFGDEVPQELSNAVVEASSGVQEAAKADFYDQQGVQLADSGQPLDVTPDRADELENQFQEEMAANQPALEAATIAALAVSNPREYFESMRESLNNQASNVVVENTSRVSIENFDNAKFEQYKTATIEFNYRAAKQSEVGRIFFPMIVCTPEQSLFKAEITLAAMGKSKSHNNSELFEQELISLQESYRDGSLFEDETLKLVPFVAEDKVDHNWFADKSKVASEIAKVEGTEFNTRSLRPGQTVDLIGVSQHPGRLADGEATQNTQIAPNVKLKHVDIEVKTATASTVIRVPMTDVPGSDFAYHQGAGSDRYMTLSLLNQNAIKVDDKSDIFKPARDIGASVYWKFDFTGRVEIARGNLKVNGDIEIGEVRDASGEVKDIDFEITEVNFVGYAVDARASNTDLAIMGDLVSCYKYFEHYRVGLRSPIAAHTSLVKSGNNPGTMTPQEKLKVITEFVRSQMDNDAHKEIDRYMASMASTHDHRLTSGSLVGRIFECEAVRGVAAKILTPIKLVTEIDMKQFVNTLKSSERLEDVKGAFVAKLIAVVTRLDQDSGFSLACKSYGYGDENFKPLAKILTSRRLASLMMVNGDTRTLGPEFDHVVAKTDRTAFYDRIVVQLSAPQRRVGEFDPLVGGNCIYIPEFVGEFPLKRGQSTLLETAVQPQYLHIINVPVFADIRVKHVDEFFGEKASVNTEEQTTP